MVRRPRSKRSSAGDSCCSPRLRYVPPPSSLRLDVGSRLGSIVCCGHRDLPGQPSCDSHHAILTGLAAQLHRSDQTPAILARPSPAPPLIAQRNGATATAGRAARSGPRTSGTCWPDPATCWAGSTARPTRRAGASPTGSASDRTWCCRPRRCGSAPARHADEVRTVNEVVVYDRDTTTAAGWSAPRATGARSSRSATSWPTSSAWSAVAGVRHAPCAPGPYLRVHRARAALRRPDPDLLAADEAVLAVLGHAARRLRPRRRADARPGGRGRRGEGPAGGRPDPASGRWPSWAPRCTTRRTSWPVRFTGTPATRSPATGGCCACGSRCPGCCGPAPTCPGSPPSTGSAATATTRRAFRADVRLHARRRRAELRCRSRRRCRRPRPRPAGRPGRRGRRRRCRRRRSRAVRSRPCCARSRRIRPVRPE